MFKNKRVYDLFETIYGKYILDDVVAASCHSDMYKDIEAYQALINNYS